MILKPRAASRVTCSRTKGYDDKTLGFSDGKPGYGNRVLTRCFQFINERYSVAVGRYRRANKSNLGVRRLPASGEPSRARSRSVGFELDRSRPIGRRRRLSADLILRVFFRGFGSRIFKRIFLSFIRDTASQGVHPSHWRFPCCRIHTLGYQHLGSLVFSIQDPMGFGKSNRLRILLRFVSHATKILMRIIFTKILSSSSLLVELSRYNQCAHECIVGRLERTVEKVTMTSSESLIIEFVPSKE